MPEKIGDITLLRDDNAPPEARAEASLRWGSRPEPLLRSAGGTPAEAVLDIGAQMRSLATSDPLPEEGAAPGGEGRGDTWRPTETELGCISAAYVDDRVGCPSRYEVRFRRTWGHRQGEEITGEGADLGDALFSLAAKVQDSIAALLVKNGREAPSHRNVVIKMPRDLWEAMAPLDESYLGGAAAYLEACAMEEAEKWR